jgi:hypothetical protein
VPTSISVQLVSLQEVSAKEKPRAVPGGNFSTKI